ncbi:MAG: hypothetical protein U0103_05175 [Candidatus Obscuribacterales bacterium]|nr:hypothetical protein [Cyanobacteria bacterium SZAS LIN-5]
MERFPKLESLRNCLSLAVMALVGSTQLALADSNAPPGSQILPGVYQGGPVIAQQSGWPNTPPQWQSNPGNTSSMPAPPPQNPSYQPQPILPSNDPNPYGTSVPAQTMQGYTQFQQQQPQIQPGQLQGYPVSQQAPGQLPPQGYGGAPPQYPQQGYAQQQQPQYPPQSQQASAPASPPGWQADYPNPNDVNNTASQVPMDTAQPQKAGIGSKLGKALGGVAKMAGPMAGMGMAGMAAASMGNMMMGGMGMGGYGMPMGGMGMGGMGMGGMGMGGYGMPMGMGMGGYGMPMGGMGMGMGQNMMMNSVLNQGLRMLQR